MSEYLTLRQCEGLVAAAENAARIGLPFNRHWTVHYERAGIAEREGARFVGRLRKLTGDYARRHKLKEASMWVRENGHGKGGHVHILLHLPAGLSLRGRTRKWIELAGGTCREGVSCVKIIAGSKIVGFNGDAALYRANVAAVRNYLLKGATVTAGRTLGLARYGERGSVVGKRCGWTQNISARHTNCISKPG